MRALAVLALIIPVSCSSLDTRLDADHAPRLYDGPGDVLFELAQHAARDCFGDVVVEDARQHTLSARHEDLWTGDTLVQIRVVDVEWGFSRIDFQSRCAGWNLPFSNRPESDYSEFFDTLDWYFDEHVAGRDPAKSDVALTTQERFRELRAQFDAHEISEAEYAQAQLRILTGR